MSPDAMAEIHANPSSPIRAEVPSQAPIQTAGDGSILTPINTAVGRPETAHGDEGVHEGENMNVEKKH